MTLGKIIFMEHHCDSHTDEQIREILSSSKNIAVVGMSRNPEKASHKVPKYLMSRGYNIIPVNPASEEILGEKYYPNLDEIPHEIDAVEVFLLSDQVLPVIKQAIGKNPKVI